jgi:hypothetical protein
MVAKLDLNAAWAALVALYKGHKSHVVLLAGLFLFVPLCLAGILLGQLDIRPGASDAVMRKMVTEFLSNNWYWFVLIAFVTRYGELAISMVLLDRSLPTLKDVLQVSLTLLAGFLGATVLVNIASLAISSLAIGTGALAVLINFIAFYAALFLSVRFGLLAATIAAEKTRNPLHALKRSWEITRGNMGRIFLFYVAVIFIAFVCGIMLWIFLSFLADMAMPSIIAQPITLALGAGLFATIATLVTLIGASVYAQLMPDK